MKKRRKKYEKIFDLSNIFSSEEIGKFCGDKEMIKNHYSLSSAGGMGILWQVNIKSPYCTVSSGVVSKKTIQRNIKINIYNHYVLTEKGRDFLNMEITTYLL